MMLETTGTHSAVWANADNNTLLSWWASATKQLEVQREIMGRIEIELERRMQQDGAREIPHPDWLIRLERPAPTYDQGILMGLAELVPPEEFSRAYTPAHQISVPAVINMTVAKSWAKYGGAVADTIERAKAPPLPPKLKIRPRAK